ncbi:hypothetical protein CPC08DRAFT_685293 [Agrocybe pediades]|nr:hypothetical protein CPC08DRAFT_685293 [Agrocybe pediades]
MLLRFTSPDMLNTSLVDVATGQRVYDIMTAPLPDKEGRHKPADENKPTASSSSSFVEPRDMTRRRTRITNAVGKVIANLEWTGRCPDITIGDEHIGPMTELFGTSTVPFEPKVLVIPTRFDTEYIWTATADSLTLVDDDSQLTKGRFHYNVIRIPVGSTASKLEKTLFANVPCESSSSSVRSGSTDDSKHESKPIKSTFIPARIPGVGSNYLDFASHPLADDVEIIISFLMVELVRRGRFGLPQYEFSKPKLWQFKEARDLVMRRLRRNTI